jgi:hypothetical protein
LISKKSSLKPLGQTSASEKKIFKKSTNQKQELPVVAMFGNGSGCNGQSL